MVTELVVMERAVTDRVVMERVVMERAVITIHTPPDRQGPSLSRRPGGNDKGGFASPPATKDGRSRC
jgi:hypothetical protein